MAITYTASLWTLVSTSPTIPVFDTSTYTLKGAIDNRNHTSPGNPFVYPTNIGVGQNLYCVLTAPSGGVELQRLCVSMSFEQQYGSACGAFLNPFKVRASLRSGSCAASGSATWLGFGPLEVYYQAVDDNNAYYYGQVFIQNNTSFGEECLDVDYNRTLISASAEIIYNPDYFEYVVDPCSACGVPDTVYYTYDNVVITPSSVTSSTYPAEIMIVSGGNYGVKVSSSADGLISNVDIGIGWVSSSNTPRYYTGSFGTLYYNTAISASVQKNDCSGSIGSFVLYTLPASSSNSTASYAAAQAAAQATFNANSQSYANTYGSCVNPMISFDSYISGTFVFTTSIPAPAAMTVQYAVVSGSTDLSCGSPYTTDTLNSALTIASGSTIGNGTGSSTLDCNIDTYQKSTTANMTICGTASLNDGDTFQFGGYTWDVDVLGDCNFYTCASGGQTLDVYGRYISGSDDIYYRVNSGIAQFLGTPTAGCGFIASITGLIVGDLVEFETSLLRIIGGNTGSTCPGVPGAGCSYPYTVVSGAQSVALTIRGDVAC